MASNVSLDRVVAGVSSYLGNPPNFSNLLGDVYERIIDAQEEHVNFLSLYQVDPLVKNSEITLQPGTLNYQLPSDVGGIRLLRTKPDRQGRFVEIDVVDIQDLANYQSTKSFITESDFSVPRACSRILVGTVPHLQMSVNPTSQTVCELFYEGAGKADLDLDEPPEYLVNFHGLLKAQVAFDMLPLMEWPKDKYQRFAQHLSMRLGEKKQLLERYLSQSDSEQSGFVQGWGNGRQRYGWS